MRKISRYTTRLRHRSTNARQIDFSCRMSGKLLANRAVNRIGKGRQYESGGSGIQPMEQTRHLRIVADIPDGRKPCEQRRRQRSRFPDGNGMASLPGRFVDGTQIRIRINDLKRQIRFRLHRTIRQFWNPLGANNRPKLRNIGFVGTSPILENQPVRKSIRQQSPGRSGKLSQNNFVKPLASHVLRRDGKLHCLHAQKPTIPPNTAPPPHRPRWLTAPRRLCGAIHGVTLPPPAPRAVRSPTRTHRPCPVAVGRDVPIAPPRPIARGGSPPPRRLCGAIHGVTLPPPPLPMAAHRPFARGGSPPSAESAKSRIG